MKKDKKDEFSRKLDPKTEGSHTLEGNDRKAGGRPDLSPRPNNPAKNAEKKKEKDRE